MKHLSEKQLILYEYGEPVDRARVEAHLAHCTRCRREMAALDVALKTVASSLLPPERPETYGKEVCDRLAPHLSDKTATRATAAPSRWLNWPRWGFAGAACLLAALAFLAGRYWPTRPGIPSPQAISEQARDRVLMAAVADHFERAEVLLTALKHAGQQRGRNPIDISFERELAEDLLTGNQLYQESALRDGQAGLANVLDELGRVLLSVANAPAMISPAGISELHEEIQQQGLLFKLQVLDSRLRDSAQASELRD
jgi:hypothetical protein